MKNKLTLLFEVESYPLAPENLYSAEIPFPVNPRHQQSDVDEIAYRLKKALQPLGGPANIKLVVGLADWSQSQTIFLCLASLETAGEQVKKAIFEVRQEICDEEKHRLILALLELDHMIESPPE